ncbi:MAG: hypothetical protein KJ821_03405 [Actinobacteria bacterium]|nr:hypothetical protein [Actinomycetota bacterium]
MLWEYLELRFSLEFDSSQIKHHKEETKKTFGLTDVTIKFETPEELSWNLVAITDKKKEIILSGKAIKHRESNSYYFRVDNLKSPCFQYINKLGTEGWEWFGNLPVRFVERHDNICFIELRFHHNKTIHGNPTDNYAVSTGTTWIPHLLDDFIIDIFGDSFFFKREK